MAYPAWNAMTSYVPPIVVEYDGLLWNAIQSSTNEVPARNSVYWAIVGLGSASGVSSVTGIHGISATNIGGAVTLINYGVIDISAGLGITVSDASGTVTIGAIEGGAYTAGSGIGIVGNTVSNTGAVSFTAGLGFVNSQVPPYSPTQQPAMGYSYPPNPNPSPNNFLTVYNLPVITNPPNLTYVDLTSGLQVGLGYTALWQQSSAILLTFITTTLLSNSGNAAPVHIRAIGNFSEATATPTYAEYQISYNPPFANVTVSLCLVNGVHYNTAGTPDTYLVLEGFVSYVGSFTWNAELSSVPTGIVQMMAIF